MDMTKTINRFPVYKDLEPYKQYDIQIISDIHEQIILLLTGFDIFITNKETILKAHIQKKNIGFNLDNFVNTYNYDITIIREKLSLFLDYIDFFHRIHSKYLNTFSEKLNLMISELNRDIHPETTNDQVVTETVIAEEPVVIEEPVIKEVVIEEPVIKEPIVEEPIDQNKDTIIEQLMKEAIIDYKENNNLLSEEITTIKKSINNLKLTVIVEEIADETTVKSIEETDFHEEVQVEEPIIEETVVIEEQVVEEPIIEETVVIEEPLVIEEPVVEEPIIEETVVIEEPIVVVEEQVVEEPIIEETVVIEEPVVEEGEIIIEENNQEKYNDEEQLSELSTSETSEEVFR